MRAIASGRIAFILLALAACSRAAAMEADPAPATPAVAVQSSEDQVVRVFEIRYRSLSEVRVLVSQMLSPDTVLATDESTRTVTVMDRPDVVRLVEEFVRKFDVPPHAAVVRIVLEKAELQPEATAEDSFGDAGSWNYEKLADTTLEVLERGQVTQVFGPDDAYEIHVSLESVDVERRLMSFDRLSIAKLVPSTAPPGEEPSPDDPATRARRTMLETPVLLNDRVGKVVMSARDESADVALVVRIVGLIREHGPAH